MTSVASSSSIDDVPPPPVFIPSRGRWGDKAITSRLLREYGVPHVIVVEPHEADSYRAGLAATGRKRRVPITCTTPGAPSSAVTDLVTIAVLPLSHQGVAYARRHIIRHLVPDAATLGRHSKWSQQWIWMLDDDIAAFFIADRASRQAAAADTTKVIITADGGTATDQKRRARSPHDFLFIPSPVNDDATNLMYALEYERYWQPTSRLAVNSYCCVAVALRVGGLPPWLPLYRCGVDVREDYDATLQLIAAGFNCVRRRDVAFRVPSMGSRDGGMTHVYVDSVRMTAANRRFITAWCPFTPIVAVDSAVAPSWVKLSDATDPHEVVKGGEPVEEDNPSLKPPETRSLRVDFVKATCELRERTVMKRNRAEATTPAPVLITAGATALALDTR